MLFGATRTNAYELPGAKYIGSGKVNLVALLALSLSNSIKLTSLPFPSTPFGLNVLLLPTNVVEGLASPVTVLISHLIGVLDTVSTDAK